MEQTITLNDLYKKLYDKLKMIHGLTQMYIGKTKDIDASRNRHKEEGYTFTEEIAYGDIDIINNAEIELIKRFKENNFKCGNKNNGGGQSGGTKLYVSYICDVKIKCIDDLENGELDWDVIYKLVK